MPSRDVFIICQEAVTCQYGVPEEMLRQLTTNDLPAVYAPRMRNPLTKVKELFSD
jgi:hypothetical protein